MVQFCRISILFLALALPSCKGGYSFTGGNVGDAKTMQVDFFDNNAQIVNPEASQWVTEAIKDIFVQQTPLELVQGPADMYISGEINMIYSSKKFSSPMLYWTEVKARC